MASLKGDRFQHVLERSKDMSERSKAMLERSKARQDAIEQRSKVLLERRSISRQDTKGRSKARLDVKHQQHVKKDIHEESRAAASSHVATSHMHTSIQMEESGESVGAYRVRGPSNRGRCTRFGLL
jgi:hypothetical protein